MCKGGGAEGEGENLKQAPVQSPMQGDISEHMGVGGRGPPCAWSSGRLHSPELLSDIMSVSESAVDTLKKLRRLGCLLSRAVQGRRKPLRKLEFSCL